MALYPVYYRDYPLGQLLSVQLQSAIAWREVALERDDPAIHRQQPERTAPHQRRRSTEGVNVADEADPPILPKRRRLLAHA